MAGAEGGELSAPGRVSVTRAEFVLGVPGIAALPPAESAELCMLGRSNVGKSSLINHLCNRRGLARVSREPGRTRAVNLFRVALASGLERRKVTLVDLPGYGYAHAGKQDKRAMGRLLQDYVDARRGVRAACLLLDIRRDPSDDDLAMLQVLDAAEMATLVVVTKCDKVARNARFGELARIAKALRRSREDLVAVSTSETDGRDEVLSRAWVLLAPVAAPGAR